MKVWTRIITLLFSLCLISMTSISVAASAPNEQETEEEENAPDAGDTQTLIVAKEATYTVRIFAGRQGEIIAGGNSEDVEYSKTVKVIKNLHRGDVVNVVPEEQVKLLDDKYYVKGLRVCGKDTSTVLAHESSNADNVKITVTGDADYVVAYGLKGPMVEYRVEFVDENGRELADPAIYQGKVGDKPIIAFLYIEGYRPQAYKLTKTLDKDPSKNIFRFVYTPGTIPEGVITGEGGEIITYIDGGTTVLPGGGAGGGAGGAAPAGGGGGAAIPDAETPLGGEPQDIIDLDEEETPLASGGGIFSINGNARLLGIPIPIVVTAGAVIAGGLWYMLVYRRKKKQKEIEL